MNHRLSPHLYLNDGSWVAIDGVRLHWISPSQECLWTVSAKGPVVSKVEAWFGRQSTNRMIAVCSNKGALCRSECSTLQVFNSAFPDCTLCLKMDGPENLLCGIDGTDQVLLEQYYKMKARDLDGAQFTLPIHADWYSSAVVAFAHHEPASRTFYFRQLVTLGGRKLQHTLFRVQYTVDSGVVVAARCDVCATVRFVDVGSGTKIMFARGCDKVLIGVSRETHLNETEYRFGAYSLSTLWDAPFELQTPYSTLLPYFQPLRDGNFLAYDRYSHYVVFTYSSTHQKRILDSFDAAHHQNDVRVSSPAAGYGCLQHPLRDSLLCRHSPFLNRNGLTVLSTLWTPTKNTLVAQCVWALSDPAQKAENIPSASDLPQELHRHLYAVLRARCEKL